MKRTQKANQEYLKATSGLFAVYAFSNGKRESGYIGVGLIDAFEEIARCSSKGYQVLITFASADRELIKYEIEHKCRVPYEVAKQYAVRPNFKGEYEQV